MARWSGAMPSWTPIATVDTVDLVDGSHHTFQGGSATQRGELREVQAVGQAVASAPTLLMLGRTSTVGATITAGRLAALDPSTAALAAPPKSYAMATTKPQRSATLGILLNLSFNAFGGMAKWYPGRDEIISYLGNAASLGELSLNAYTGGTPGLIGTHLIIETL